MARRRGAWCIIACILLAPFMACTASGVYQSYEERLISLDPGTEVDLLDVAWKPDGSYALIGGGNGTLLKYEGQTITDLSLMTQTQYEIQIIRWKPDGSYALLAGGTEIMNNILLKFDGSQMIDLTSDLNLSSYDSISDIEWKPDGSYALLTIDSLIMWGDLFKYDGLSFTEIPTPNSSGFNGIGWKPGTNDAYIAGDDGVLSIYNGIELTHIQTHSYLSLRDIFWHPTGSYAILTAYQNLSGRMFKYSLGNFNIISNSPNNYTNQMKWKPGGDYALAGCGFSAILTYDGTEFTKYFPVAYLGYYGGVSWHPDGENALIVGTKGVLLFYDPNPEAEPGEQDPDPDVEPEGQNPDNNGEFVNLDNQGLDLKELIQEIQESVVMIIILAIVVSLGVSGVYLRSRRNIFANMEDQRSANGTYRWEHIQSEPMDGPTYRKVPPHVPPPTGSQPAIGDIPSKPRFQILDTQYPETPFQAIQARPKFQSITCPKCGTKMSLDTSQVPIQMNCPGCGISGTVRPKI